MNAKQIIASMAPPVGLLLKYKATIGQHLQAGLTLENDPGEGYFTRYQKTGFDFLSAHISIHTDRFSNGFFWVITAYNGGKA